MPQGLLPGFHLLLPKGELRGTIITVHSTQQQDQLDEPTKYLPETGKLSLPCDMTFWRETTQL